MDNSLDNFLCQFFDIKVKRGKVDNLVAEAEHCIHAGQGVFSRGAKIRTYSNDNYRSATLRFSIRICVSHLKGSTTVGIGTIKNRNHSGMSFYSLYACPHDSNKVYLSIRNKFFSLDLG